jgi:5-deoxy-glucuronate isomerase
LIQHEKQFQEGWNPITVGGLSGIGFGLLHLKSGSVHIDLPGEERGFLLVSGRVNLLWDNGSIELERTSQLDDLPSGLCVDCSGEVRVKALSDHAELAVFRIPSRQTFPVLPILPGDVKSIPVSYGMDGTADREIRSVLDDSNGSFSSLTFGEVVNQPGRWSSFPPHHHSQEELYHYRFFPDGGFGYSGQGDSVFKVRNNDTVLIPSGLTHPQVAAPGYTMIYLWCIRHLEDDRFGPTSRIYPPDTASGF